MPEEGPSQDQVQRTVVVDYRDPDGNIDDTLRKRAEYQAKKRGDNVSPYEGLVRRFEGTQKDFREFYDALVGKVGGDRVHVETAEEVEMQDLEASSEFEYEVEVPKESVDGFLNYWFQSKLPHSEETGENTYDFNHPRLGIGSVDYDTQGIGDRTRVNIEWEAATPEAVEEFAGLFQDDLRDFESANQ